MTAPPTVTEMRARGEYFREQYAGLGRELAERAFLIDPEKMLPPARFEGTPGLSAVGAWCEFTAWHAFRERFRELQCRAHRREAEA